MWKLCDFGKRGNVYTKNNKTITQNWPSYLKWYCIYVLKQVHT